MNLRISNNTWLGKVRYNTDGSFEQFTSMIYGIRAAIVNIRTIVRRHKARTGKGMTLQQLIQVWAPSSDGNNEKAYVSRVTNLSGIKKDDHINYKDKGQIVALVHAMAIVENGLSYIERNDIGYAYDLLYPECLSHKKTSDN